MLMGLVLGLNTDYEVFFLLYGPPGCGKSVFMKITEGLVGKRNVTAMEFAQYANRFCSAIFCEKSLNLCAEISPPPPGELSRAEEALKATCSGDLMHIERKNQHPTDGHAIMRSVFGCNELPYFRDRSGAIWDRARIIPFEERFRATDKQIVGLAEQIVSSELPGVFNMAWAALRDLLKLKQFPQDPRGEVLLDEHRQFCDVEQTFVDEHCVRDAGGFISKAELHQIYCRWLRGEEGNPKKQRRFNRELKRVAPWIREESRKVNGNAVKGWVGIRLLPGSEDHPAAVPVAVLECEPEAESGEWDFLL